MVHAPAHRARPARHSSGCGSNGGVLAGGGGGGPGVGSAAVGAASAGKTEARHVGQVRRSSQERRRRKRNMWPHASLAEDMLWRRRRGTRQVCGVRGKRGGGGGGGAGWGQGFGGAR